VLLAFSTYATVKYFDLKPENVMIVPAPEMRERIKIMDFGLAKVHEAGTGVSETLTVAGVAMGTLGYMAPEELAGKPVDARADIFAIGVMLVESLTGTRPSPAARRRK
jgi:serine/threonine-protein kinase